MDQPICGLHPGIAVTGFCSACLRERLAGLHPSDPADPAELRRCKSFSYARSAAAYFEPQRRSCDVRGAAALFQQEPPGDLEDLPPTAMRPMKDHINQEKKAAGTFGGLGKKWQEWRRKSKVKKQEPGPTTSISSGRAAMPVPHEDPRHRSFRDARSEVAVDALGRRSVDVDAALFSMDAGRISVDEQPRPSCDGYHGVRPRLPPMLSLVEDAPIPRSDGQIPVEEDDGAEPGGCAQTRDYYLDSSSSSRRRRSVDRSSFSSRKSFSDASDLPRMVAGANANANARVSPAIGAEFYQYHHAQSQSVLDHNQHWEQGLYNSHSLRDRDDDMSGSLDSAAFRGGIPLPAKKSKKGIKGWSIWGLINKKSSTKESEATSLANRSFSENWPELRARGYNGQMLRCNSSVSARSSFGNGGAAMGVASGRRSNVEMHVNGLGRMRKDEVLLERNFSARYAPCTGDNGGIPIPVGGGNQFSRRNHNGMSGKGRPARSSNSLPRSALGMY
ncbi:protein OCTOPUS-like [Lolium rigidum]|uniref:protein OCTOPUS-like n=1 Tax=Lolium rigidum TaxID=89674 RepID=UPI001F5DC3BB|nr:protein OCTOPUS-like [Lolium rigidum]